MTAWGRPVTDLLEPTPAKITANDVRVGLKKAFPAPRYSVLFEVLDATGARQTRSADAVIMSCWPSDGLELHGVEIKVARSDWMSELRNPKKAETIAQHCDRWWLVTAPGVVRDVSELPPAWGWRVFDGKSLKTMKDAARTPAKEPTRLFLASVLRNAGALSEGALQDAIRRAREGVEEEVERRVTMRLKARTPKDTEALLEQVRAFEAATGIELAKEESWGHLAVANGSKVGAMVKAITESGLDQSWRGGLNGALRAMAETVKALQEFGSQLGVDVSGEDPFAPKKKRRKGS